MSFLSKLCAVIPSVSQALLGISILFVTYCVYNLYFHPLSPLPGPISARLGLPFWQIYHNYIGDYAWALKGIHDIYGDSVRVGPISVSTTDAGAAKVIYTHGNNYYKTNFYTAYREFLLFRRKNIAQTTQLPLRERGSEYIFPN